MKVLIACEFSGVVRNEFCKLGHDSWSCDLLPTEIPGNHIQGDVLSILDKGWDLMIAHPPCTHLAVSGARHFKQKIADGRQQMAINFFMALANSNIPKIAIENPICIMSKLLRKPEQIIHPYMFGDEFSKSTCLWLKNLPKLIQTHFDAPLFNMSVNKGKIITFKSGKRMSEWMAKSYGDGHTRSRTFPGIAKAMATQWG